MEALWRVPEITTAVLRDPVFRMLGASGAVLVPDGIDWLEAVGRSPRSTRISGWSSAAVPGPLRNPWCMP